jgi:hypothetical protein
MVKLAKAEVAAVAGVALEAAAAMARTIAAALLALARLPNLLKGKRRARTKGKTVSCGNLKSYARSLLKIDC